jgi:acetyltransferase-like isoleucine patch superfamily enzyme
VGKETFAWVKILVLSPSAFLLLTGGGKIILGENSQLSQFSRIGAHGNVCIGNNVLTGPHVFVADYNHEYKNPEIPVMFQGDTEVRVFEDGTSLHIGDDSWIGTNVVVVGNVRIGKHCVIGANSVVTQSIPDYSVAVGCPAKVVKRYNSDAGLWEAVEK